ncbi:MAG: NirD/YgiW/YdeI family stress tolerance protein [Treponema sp.]|jgi:uncharacterized protein (TIGR00156 family)|nr:NirD/YgiW/YdeI family stress tolerance protein [Treponema sp.]
MKRSWFCPVICLAGLFIVELLVPGQPLYGDGYTGPNSEATKSWPAPIDITVAEALILRADTPVRLRGNITRALGDEKFDFRDNTGAIIIMIDHKLWQGLTVDASDAVEVRGHITKRQNANQIDVKEIIKR